MVCYDCQEELARQAGIASTKRHSLATRRWSMPMSSLLALAPVGADRISIQPTWAFTSGLSTGLVTRAAAGYDYSANWVTCTDGTFTFRSSTSFTALYGSLLRRFRDGTRRVSPVAWRILAIVVSL